MKTIIIALLLVVGLQSFGQKNECKITITKDDFNGKQKISSRDNRILEKLYIAEAMLNKNKEGWGLTVGFLQTDQLQLRVKHEGNGYNLNSPKQLDIKFTDGIVFTFDAPTPGEYVKGGIMDLPSQTTYFPLTREQVNKFATSLIAKSRVIFANMPDDPEVEKELKAPKAEKIRIEALCFKGALQ